MEKSFYIVTTAILGISIGLHSAPQSKEPKKTQSKRADVYSPEQELAGFTVPDGYVVELVASERDGLINPIDLAFDDAGRIWTQTAKMYPLDPVNNIRAAQRNFLLDNPSAQDKNPEFKRIKDLYEGKTKGIDEILILSNIYGDDKLKVSKFATGLTIPQSILPYKNGAFVMQGSEMFYLEDTDNDGVGDKRSQVLTGFGFIDTHTMGHCLVRSPGGWVNFSHGAMNKGDIKAVKSGESTRIDFSNIARFSLDGNHIEVETEGLNNIWGLQLRSSGQWFMTEANDRSWSIVPADPFTNFWGIGNKKLRDYQPEFPDLHDFRVGGTGISGLAFCDDLTGKFAEDYKDVAFLANAITSKINCVKIIRNADGTVTSEHLPDFLVSKDDWFRPVHMDFGPDGNLYVVDWYNKIVSHNEVDNEHPDRDKSHGRIWRIRPKNAAERKIPNLYKVPSKQLIAHLKSPYMWERKAAWQQIADRNPKELTPQLKKLVSDTSAHISIRISALWSLESLGVFDENLYTNLAKDKDADMRREVLRAVVNLDVSPEFLASLLSNISKEPHVLVRSQAIRSIEQLGKTNPALIDIAVSFCHPAAKDNKLGAGYDINFERYLARRALEKYSTELTVYLKTAAAEKQPVEKLIWAQQSLRKQTSAGFAKQWESMKKKPLDAEALGIVSELSADEKVRAIVKPYFTQKKRTKQIAEVALKNIPSVYTKTIGLTLGETSQQLIKSSEESDIILGLQLGKAYRITHLSPQYAALLKQAKTDTLKLEIIETLGYDAKRHANVFQKIVADKSNSTNVRSAALSALVLAKKNAALPAVMAFIKDEPSNKLGMIMSLGSHVQGCQLLTKLVDKKIISAEEIPHNIAQRIGDIIKKGATAKTADAIFKNAETRSKADEKAATSKIDAIIKHIAKNPGNVETGKAVFTGMCLSCHVVGKDGAGIGPALDGSANRDTNHLLTAILKPNEAAESAYILYRVTESSGHITEGLKQLQDNRGTAIAHQGGRKTFIPSRTSRKQEFVGSTSFMTSGQFDKLPVNVVADIVAYMKTLK